MRVDFACGLVLSAALMCPLELLGAEPVLEPAQQTAAPQSQVLPAEPAPLSMEPQSQGIPAEPKTEAASPPAPPEQQSEMPFVSELLDTADAPRNYWSGKFVDFANDIDRFFGDPRYFQEANKSVLQLNFTKVQQPGGGGNIVLDGQAKMDLPSTERRFKLMLESNPEKNVSGDATQVRPVIANDVVTSNNPSAALRYEKPAESPWHYSADMGVEARVPLQPFVRTRGSYSIPMDMWRMKIAETVFWFGSIGVGETSQLDLEKFISESVLFRTTSTATWMNDPHNFDLRQDFSVYHTVNERTAMLYQASVIGASQPQLEATEYVLLMLYRYRLHRKWVFFELSPQIHFPKAADFQLSPLLQLRLEFLFDSSK